MPALYKSLSLTGVPVRLHYWLVAVRAGVMSCSRRQDSMFGSTSREEQCYHVAMKMNWRRYRRLGMGSILVGVGIPLMPLPIVNGTALVVMGLIILSLESKHMAKWLEYFERKHPKIGGFVHDIRTFISKYV